MIKKILPKSPVAAAGVGILLGAGIGGFKGWVGVKRGELTPKEAVAGAVKQSVMFGGVAAVSTLATGSKGGGAGLATMAVMGLSGGGGALPSMLLGGVTGGGRRGGMGGGMRGGTGAGGMGKTGGGQGMPGKGGTQPSESILDTFSNAVAEMIMPDSNQPKNRPNHSLPESVEIDGQLEPETESVVEAQDRDGIQ